MQIDLAKELKPLYTGRASVVQVVDVPELSWLMIDGAGDPNNSAEYAQALEALYSLAYTCKFMLKLGPQGIDYRVMPLEGLWWTPDMAQFSLERKEDWLWTMMIALPDVVTTAHVAAARAKAAQKRDLPALTRIRLERFHEGRAAQILHLGPYSAEGPVVARLHQFIAKNGYELAGKHHEVYMGDPRRTAPEKLKTIIRQPMRRRE